MTLTSTSLPQRTGFYDLTTGYFHYSSRMLGFITWLSCGLFGLYILIFYLGSLLSGTASDWNSMLPNLYIKSQTASTVGITIHFAAGGIILAMGFIQLLQSVRHSLPGVHRWLGRIYVIAAILAGLGGLIFIAFTGTIGGLVMDIGFGLYGFLLLLCALQTYSYARQLKFERHQEWAIRLFALAIGSWLYRMEYGFWFIMTDGLGHDQDFHGTLDFAMAFLFYLPNLLVAESYLRGRSAQVSKPAKFFTASMMSLAALFLAIATYFFARNYWWPRILMKALL